MKSKSKIGDHYRQGDVLILYVPELPETLVPIKRDGGRVILAYGEVTGHSHAIEDKRAKLFMSGSEMYLDIEKQSKVWHEDHNPKQDDKPMILPTGKCRIIHQVEFKRKEIVSVAD